VCRLAPVSNRAPLDTHLQVSDTDPQHQPQVSQRYIRVNKAQEENYGFRLEDDSAQHLGMKVIKIHSEGAVVGILQAGDRITQINGASTVGASLDHAANILDTCPLGCIMQVVTPNSVEQDVEFAGFHDPEASRTSSIQMAMQPRLDGRQQREAIEAANDSRDLKLGELESRLDEIWSRFGILVTELQSVASKKRKDTGSVSKWRRSKPTRSAASLEAVVFDFPLPTGVDSARSPAPQAPKKEAAELLSKPRTSKPTTQGTKPDQAWV
jgi:hypothetical protein